MGGSEIYLDLVMLINGGMDALLLILLARLMHFPIHPQRIIGSVLLGEIPVVLVCYASNIWVLLFKGMIPFLMVIVAFPTGRVGTLLKAFAGFWFLSAGSGGLIYGMWGWATFDGGHSEEQLSLLISNVWILPSGALVWWMIQRFWQRSQERKAILKRSIYDLKIKFDERDGKNVCIKALMDTGNHLRDPLTGFPVILLEREVAASVVPEKMRSFLNSTWKEEKDPWPLLWKINPDLVKRFVFIPFQSIDTQSWLLGIRPDRVEYMSNHGLRQIKATVALVDRTLSSEGEYQALLHPEHVGKGGDG